MVLTADDEIKVSKQKHELKVEFENLRHKNEMEELEKQLEIAKIPQRDK